MQSRRQFDRGITRKIEYGESRYSREAPGIRAAFVLCTTRKRPVPVSHYDTRIELDSFVERPASLASSISRPVSRVTNFPRPSALSKCSTLCYVASRYIDSRFPLPRLIAVSETLAAGTAWRWWLPIVKHPCRDKREIRPAFRNRTLNAIALKSAPVLCPPTIISGDTRQPTDSSRFHRRSSLFVDHDEREKFLLFLLSRSSTSGFPNPPIRYIFCMPLRDQTHSTYFSPPILVPEDQRSCSLFIWKVLSFYFRSLRCHYCYYHQSWITKAHSTVTPA